MVMNNYLTWDKTVQTMEGVLSIASRSGHCAETLCAGHEMRLQSAEGHQIALPGFTYGNDVVVRIGWMRQERRDTYAEIREGLVSRIQICESHIRYLYQQVYLPMLACHERQHWPQLSKAAQQHGGLFITLDGLAPEGGEPQLWFIRELLTGLTLRSGWLSRFDQVTFEAFLQPLRQLPWAILGVLSDKQRGLVPAVSTVFPGICHHFCHAHYLTNLAEPLADADSAFKVELRKAVRQEVGPLVRAEALTTASSPGVLTVTGLIPEEISATVELDHSSNQSPNAAAGNEIVTQLLRHTRYLLTLKGRPPFRLAGIETYQRLQRVVSLTEELLDHRYDHRVARLGKGIQTALLPYANQYQSLQQGAAWLHDINCILAPSDDHPITGEQVADQLRTYLDGLLNLSDLSPHQDAFRRHLNKVSTSYWPGLFHCYDLQALSRTNNDLESHFRDTQRRLLRTTGQKGQTRHTLQRIGAWELLPRPPTELECLTALRQISPAQLAKEQQRLRHHQERFCLHTRSTRQINAHFDKLRQQWLALAATSSG